jgi:hypothetical protein
VVHDASIAFRRHLAARLLGLLGVATLTAESAACSSNEILSPTPGYGGAGGTTARASSSSTGGASAASSTSSGMPCSVSTDCPCWQCTCAGLSSPGMAQLCIHGTCPSGEGACALVCGSLNALPTLATKVACSGTGGGPPTTLACFAMPDAGGCPTNFGVALNDFLALGCPNGFEPFQIVSGPMTNGEGQCCYQVRDVLCTSGGRPFIVDRIACVAPALTGASSDWCSGSLAPDTASLSPLARAALARAWTADALAEHASIASFARASLALLAAGAPAELLAATHAAAVDEVRHARACFALASAYAGELASPGRFPVDGELRVSAGLVDLALATLDEGCIGETIAAVLAAERAARATDPVVRRALAAIAADEARHAELAWRTLAWVIAAGGADVLGAVMVALPQRLAMPVGASADVDLEPPGSEAHGVLRASTASRVARAALGEVVVPAARGLLAAATRGATTEPARRASEALRPRDPISW